MRSARSGQAMLIAILTLGGAMLGATTIAGFLMLYTIRASTDSTNSAKALFAADSSVNWALESYFNPPAPQPPVFSNGATSSATCFDANNNEVPCDNTGVTTTSYAIARGTSLDSRRAFWIDLANATGVFP